MARYWDNKEIPGRGTKFCFVIDPEDGTQPIRTYGWSQDEVIDKVGKTAEAAQQVINRQRQERTHSIEVNGNNGRTVETSTKVTPPLRPVVSADEQMQATQDLSNPAKAPQAVKTLLRAVGFDVDQLRHQEEVRRMANVAQEWERNHPDFPKEPRNQRLLLDRAVMKVGGTGITAEVLDQCYQELLSQNMLFEVSSETEIENPPIAPNGNPATRVERPREATSYRRTALSSKVPAPSSQKPKYTRAEIDSWDSRKLRDKIENEPGFKETYNSLMATA